MPSRIERIVTIRAFGRDVKSLKRKHYRLELMLKAVRAIAEGDRDVLSTKYRDHPLQGEWKGYRELHISGDWLLTYRIEGSRMVLVLTRTASHDELYSAQISSKDIKG